MVHLGVPDGTEILYVGRVEGPQSGRSSLTLDVDESVACIILLEPRRTSPTHDEADLIRSALVHPIDSPPLADLVSSGQRVVAVTRDVPRTGALPVRMLM